MAEDRLSLLAADDGSAAAAGLLAAACQVALAAGWSVRRLHVAEGQAGAEHRAPPDAGAPRRTVGGDPAAEILRAAQQGDVAAVALGLRSDERPGLGHVAREILVQAERILLLVRPGMRSIASLRRILVPLEGSPSTSAAMRVADDAFCGPGRELVLVHVVTGDTPDEPGSMPAPRFMDQEHYEWTAWQDEFTMRFSQCTRGGRHRVLARVGDPAAAILKEARELDAELMVLSWKRRLGPGQATRLRRLLESSPCPLLLVPQT